MALLYTMSLYLIVVKTIVFFRNPLKPVYFVETGPTLTINKLSCSLSNIKFSSPNYKLTSTINTIVYSFSLFIYRQ